MSLYLLPPGTTRQVVFAASGAHQPPVDRYLIANLDNLNLVYVGPADADRQRPDLLADPSRSIITGLQSITVTSALDWYVYNPSATASVQIDVIPDCDYWAPSPAQTAIQIAQTGVFALNSKTTTQIASSLAIAAGATTALTAITGINQPAYNLHLTLTAGGASTKPFATVTLKWVDTASGLTVQVDSFTTTMSSTSNVMSTVIAGPTNADQLQVSVTNLDTVAMTVNVAYAIISSRSNYTADVCYQFWTTAAMPTIPTFQIGAAVPVPTNKILFSVNRTVGNGVTTTPDYILPVYAGQVAIGFNGQSSNNWDVVFTDQLTGTILYRIALAAGNNQDQVFIFPRSPVSMHITNNGTVLGTVNCEVSAI